MTGRLRGPAGPLLSDRLFMALDSACPIQGNAQI